MLCHGGILGFLGTGTTASCDVKHMGDCQNYGPFLGPYYNTGPNTVPNLGDPKRDHNFDNPPHPNPSSLTCHMLIKRMYMRACMQMSSDVCTSICIGDCVCALL